MHITVVGNPFGGWGGGVVRTKKNYDVCTTAYTCISLMLCFVIAYTCTLNSIKRCTLSIMSVYFGDNINKYIVISRNDNKYMSTRVLDYRSAIINID